MFKLIQNEWIKIFSKVSTYIMLGLLLLLTFGMSFIMKKTSGYGAYSYTYTKENIESEIAYLNSSKPEGYELQVAEYEYMLNSGREWNINSWEYEAMQEAWQTWQAPLMTQDLSDEEKNILQSSFEETMRLIENSNWKGYAELRLQQIEEGSGTAALKEAESYPYRCMLECEVEPGTGDWREDRIREAGTARKELALMEQQREEGVYVSEESYEDAENRKAVSEYCLEHGIEHYIDENGSTGSRYWTAVLEESMLVTIVSVIMIVLAGGCVANEFTNGTIKFLLVNPVSRRKIIISKYLTMCLVAFLLILGLYGVVLLVNLPFFGMDFHVPYLTAVNGTVTVGNSFFYGLQKYLLEGVSLAAMTTMAFMISSMVRSSALAIGIGVTALMGGSVLVTFLSQLGCDWGRYLIFSNLTLSQTAVGNTMFPNQSLEFSIAVVVVHIIIFLLMAYDGFTRREV